MADALCGPTNALQNFQKQSSVDRTLQQDRVIARQAPAESFRSKPGLNAGILDAEFEAFQVGQPLQARYPEPDQIYHGHSANTFQQNNGQPRLPDWALDFQNMHLNETRASPIPQSQFRHHAPLQHTGEWHQDFLRQQHQPSLEQPHQPLTSSNQNYSGWSYGYTGALIPQHHNTLSPMTQQKQPEWQTEDVYDEAAFEKAFDAAREEMQQSEESARAKETQSDMGLHDMKAQDSLEQLEHSLIGSDRILDEAQARGEEGKGIDDAEELARTAGQLLENIKGDQSQKFKDSNFLSLMRQLRDREVRVEGDKLVDSSQPLHPGGSGYPIHHARPDYPFKGETHEFATTTNKEYKVDLPLLSPPDQEFSSTHVPKPSEATDGPTKYTPAETIVKKPAEDDQQKQAALHDYQLRPPEQPEIPDELDKLQMKLEMLEMLKRQRRLPMARQEQDTFKSQSNA